jgi:DNA-binding CsgD family transcriptional regulator
MAPKRHHAEGLVRRRRPAAGQRIVLLGHRYPQTYLTEREAHCALLLLRGCTAREAAKQMSLSSRTVEYYISNIKSKLGLRKKSGVVAALLDSDFIMNLRRMMFDDEAIAEAANPG